MYEHQLFLVLSTVAAMVLAAPGITVEEYRRISPLEVRPSGVGLLPPDRDKYRGTMHTTSVTFAETYSLDKEMLNFLQDNHYEGAAIGVAREDRLVYAQGYGTTKDGTPMKPTTLSPISSLSKTITAVAILKLVEHGELRLTDRVFGPAGLLRDLTPSPVEPNSGVYSITVEHLLHHTAGWSQHKRGLYDPMMNTVYQAQGINIVNISQELGLTGPLTPDDIISYMLSQPLDHSAPGVKYEYSNFGYCVLGRVVETVSGQSYRRFVNDEILTPLGMWHTRIGPHKAHGDDVDNDQVNTQFPKITLPDGFIPLLDGLQDTSKLPYDLLDSTLGWFSNVHDLMRFATGLTSGLVINRSTLRLMSKHPDPPVFEHTDTWQGLGIHVGNDHTWWQTGDPHDNEIILFHRNQQSPRHGKELHKHNEASENWSWVMIMSKNNRHNLRDVFGRMSSAVSHWPDVDMMVDDCADFVFTSRKHRVMMHSKIPEHHFYTVTQALARQGYHPTWIDGYTSGDKTYFAVISELDLADDDFKVEIDATSSDLNTLLIESKKSSYYLNYVTSYVSHRNNGQIRHAAIFGVNERKTAHVGWQESWRTFVSTADELLNEQGLTPIIQSIVTSGDYRKEVTYMFEKHKHTTSKLLANLTIAELDLQIRSNAVTDYILSYLDSYSENGNTYFSAIFTSWKVGKWHVQTGLSKREFLHSCALYQGLGYRPRMVVGYENEGMPQYAVMWVRH